MALVVSVEDVVFESYDLGLHADIDNLNFLYLLSHFILTRLRTIPELHHASF